LQEFFELQDDLKDQAAKYVLFNFRVFKRVKAEKARKKALADEKGTKGKKGKGVRRTTTIKPKPKPAEGGGDATGTASPQNEA
jgi:hypothetical protein